MAGFSPKLPLTLDPDDGYALTKTIKEVARQNFKMLILTNPGERIMEPDFGVGINSFLFENNTAAVYSQIDARIREQASKYLPFIEVGEIDFNSSEVNPNLADNFLGVSIKYSIKRLNIGDVLQIPLN
jgi:phage baseplate assembly protein W